MVSQRGRGQSRGREQEQRLRERSSSRNKRAQSKTSRRSRVSKDGNRRDDVKYQGDIINVSTMVHRRSNACDRKRVVSEVGLNAREVVSESGLNSHNVEVAGLEKKYVEVCGGSSSISTSSAEPFSLPVVEEPPPDSDLEKEWMSIVGRLELVLLEDQDENGNIVNRRLQIICLPSDSSLVVSDYRYELDEVVDADLLESPLTAMLETITNGFMDSCGQGELCTSPRSVLRRNNGDRDRILNLKRIVSFDKVNIHEFKITLGDHPSASSGPPVAIDWERKRRVTSLPLDEYEQNRQPRRHRKQLKMSLKTRCGILQKEAHFSAHEITQAWENALLVRKQRRETLKGGLWKMVQDDFWESANRKMNRITNSVTGMIL